MKSIGIKELQTNPAILTKALEAKEYTIITKRSLPIGIALSLDDTVLSSGVKTSLLIDGYKSGNISLGQFCKALKISKAQGLKTLSMMGLDVVEYDFKEDLKNMDSFYDSKR